MNPLPSGERARVRGLMGVNINNPPHLNPLPGEAVSQLPQSTGMPPYVVGAYAIRPYIAAQPRQGEETFAKLAFWDNPPTLIAVDLKPEAQSPKPALKLNLRLG